MSRPNIQFKNLATVRPLKEVVPASNAYQYTGISILFLQLMLLMR